MTLWSPEERLRLVTMQPRPLVRHNSLLWTVHDITDDSEDNIVTLKMKNVSAVTMQVPIQSCELVTRPRALPRAAARRCAFMEVEQLRRRYVVGPKPFLVDADGTGHRLSDKWVTTGPLSFWPAGLYKPVDLADVAPTQYNPKLFYTFTLKNDKTKRNFEECHRAMQHLNVRPDILAACGSPAVRGSDSWTYTCTLAALGWAHIDQTSKQIVLSNPLVKIVAYDRSVGHGTPIGDLTPWALPMVTPVRLAPISIGADLMGLRTQSVAEVAETVFTFSSEGEKSPVTEQRRCWAFVNTHARMLTDAEVALFHRVALGVAPNELLVQLLKEHANAPATLKAAGADGESIVRALYVDETSEDELTKRFEDMSTWAMGLTTETIKGRPFTALFYVAPQVTEDRLQATMEGLEQLSVSNLFGAVWEYLIAKSGANGPVASKIARTSKFQLSSHLLVQAATLQKGGCNYVHGYSTENHTHVFYNRSKPECEQFFATSFQTDVVFASQTFPEPPQWDEEPLVLGTFAYLHPTAPMRPRSDGTSRVWKIPLHPEDLIELAYGDGKYPNICEHYVGELQHVQGYVLLDPPLPPQNVLDDLFAHVAENTSSAVYCAALAAHGPVGVTGLAKNTWTVVYEYYAAMGVPQNAYMQYIALAYADELLASVYEAGKRQGKNKDTSSSWMALFANVALTYASSKLLAGSALARTLFSFLSAETVTQIKAKVGEAISSTEEDEIDVDAIIAKFCKRVNAIMVGTIAGAYIVSRTNVRTIEDSLPGQSAVALRLIFESLDLKTIGFGRNLAMTNWWREMQLSPTRFVQNRTNQLAIAALELAGIDRFDLQKALANLNGVAPLMVKSTYRYRGKVDPTWTRRYYSTRASHIKYAATAYDVQRLYFHGRERPATIEFHSAELLFLCCTSGKVHEHWATAEGVDAVRKIHTGVDDLRAASTQFVRSLGRPPPRVGAPVQILPSFAVSAPVTPTDWIRTDTWISTRPALSGFGFIAEMNKLASEAAQADLQIPTGFVASVLATATAKVYARNAMILVSWLSRDPADKGPRFAVNAPVSRTHTRPPARRAVPGLLPSSALMDLYG